MSPDKRTAIMDAATTAFLRNGYKGTSMDEIAALARVSKQTVYKHFADKASLFSAIVNAAVEAAGDPVMEEADALAWDSAGRWLAGGVLVLAAAYELTGLKDACLGKCRSPLGFLLGAWRDGRAGALRMGARHGAWCVGCCWALMASLFALGVMSIAWMAFVAALIAAEKILPWRRTATYGTAAILLALGVLLLVAPDAVPALTIPGGDAMPAMDQMAP